jgi:hypothetical protein
MATKGALFGDIYLKESTSNYVFDDDIFMQTDG